jgi:hypothetical protein
MKKKRFDYWAGLFALGIVFLIPRAVRFFHSEVWIEDPFYLYGPYLITEGFYPFRDFIHSQFPGAEYVLAFFYALFGSSYHVAEALNQVLVYVTTWLVFLLGKRLFGVAGGVGAAIVLSLSSLIFRYHVWQREILILALLAGTYYSLLRTGPVRIRQFLLPALLLSLAVSIKLTSVIYIAAAAMFLILSQRSVRGAVILGTMTGVFTLLMLSPFLFMEAFWEQTILLHLIKGTNYTSVLKALRAPLRFLEFTLALGVVGLPFLRKSNFPAFWLPILLVIAEVLFLAFINPNVWAHQLIPVLLPLSLCAGLLIHVVTEHLSQKRIIIPIASLVAVCLLMTFVIPVRNANSPEGSFFGFGYVARKDIAELSEFIRLNTTSEDILLLPQYIASEADRHNAVPHCLESFGLVSWLNTQREKKSIKEILEFVGDKTRRDMDEATIVSGWTEMGFPRMLQEKQFKFIVNDIIPASIYVRNPEALLHFGYVQSQYFGPYVVWARRGEVPIDIR